MTGRRRAARRRVVLKRVAHSAGPDVFDEAGLEEVDPARQRKGDNTLQGDDPSSVRDQRHAQPDAKREPDTRVRESVEKIDKDHRAREALGKGNRCSRSG